jgi:hypothetical protein
MADERRKNPPVKKPEHPTDEPVKTVWKEERRKDDRRQAQ